MRFFGNKGFSLPEAIIGLGLLAGLGVAGMYMSSTMQKSSTGIKKLGDIDRAMIQIRNLMSDRQACQNTLGGKTKDTLITIMDRTNTKMMGQGDKIADKGMSTDPGAGAATYEIKEIKVEELYPNRKRVRISVLFHRLTKDGRAADTRKHMNIMAKMNAAGTAVEECIDPGSVLDQSIVNKLCFDADPVNFSKDPSTNVITITDDNIDCADNIANLVEEIKFEYCKYNGLFGDPATGKCKPIDMNKTTCKASGSYLRGFKSDGSPDCYSPASPDPVVDNVPELKCWEAPTPGAVCETAGSCATDGLTSSAQCSDGSGNWNLTTLACRPKSTRCAVYGEAPTPFLCWEGTTGKAVCDKSGPCTTQGDTTTATCYNSTGVGLSSTLTCKESSANCAIAPSGCRAVTDKQWSSGSNTCKGDLAPAQNFDPPQTINNKVAGNNGKATFECRNNAWFGPTVSNCDKPCTEGAIRANPDTGVSEVCKSGVWVPRPIVTYCTPPSKMSKDDDEWMKFHTSSFKARGSDCTRDQIRDRADDTVLDVDGSYSKVKYDDYSDRCSNNSNCKGCYDPSKPDSSGNCEEASTPSGSTTNPAPNPFNPNPGFGGELQ